MKYDIINNGNFTVISKKLCCRKETHDVAAVLFGLKFADNIHYKFKSSQARKPYFRALNMLAQNRI